MAIVALLFIDSVWCQTASRIRTYSETTVSDVHLQVYNSNLHTLLYYKESGTSRDVFLYSNNPYSKKFTMSIFANPNGQVAYTVNDMKIIGNRCFFCGKMTIPIQSAILPPVIDRTLVNIEKGYLACLYLDSIEDPNNPNIRCRFSYIDKTLEMNKLAISSNYNDTTIAMIGRYDTIDPTSCLVKVISDASSWEYIVYYFTDTTETLTDIAITEKSLVTASRFGGESTTFGLRYINLDDFFLYDNITEYKTLNKFNTQSLLINPPSPPATAWHRNDATIRLVAIPYSNDVIVGQECHYFTGYQSAFDSYIDLYLIDGDDPLNITMADALRSPCTTHYPDVFYDMRYIPDGDNPQNGKVVILEKSPNAPHYPGILDIISWGSNSMSCYLNDWILPSSLDIAPNNHVWVGGVRNESYTIVQYCQDITTTYSCLLYNNYSTTTLSPMPENNTYIKTLEKKDSKEFQWEWKDRSVPTLTPYEVNCIFPLDD